MVWTFFVDDNAPWTPLACPQGQNPIDAPLADGHLVLCVWSGEQCRFRLAVVGVLQSCGAWQGGRVPILKALEAVLMVKNSTKRAFCFDASPNS